MPGEIIILLVLVALVGVLLRHAVDQKHIRQLQFEATEAFENLRVESSDSRLCFNGSTAVVDRREETGGARGVWDKRASLSVSIYARNEHGEKFLFKWNSMSNHQPFFKHLPQQAHLNSALSKCPNWPQ